MGNLSKGLRLWCTISYQWSESITVLGARNYGESIPCISSIDVDSILESKQRTRELDLRVWISGFDESGREVNKTYNDLDTPRGIWALEQRVADFELREIEDLDRLKGWRCSRFGARN